VSNEIVNATINMLTTVRRKGKKRKNQPSYWERGKTQNAFAFTAIVVHMEANSDECENREKKNKECYVEKSRVERNKENNIVFLAYLVPHYSFLQFSCRVLNIICFYNA
jgi:hypothetical protein